jgi:adenine-specific DNA-methyltransferase
MSDDRNDNGAGGSNDSGGNNAESGLLERIAVLEAENKALKGRKKFGLVWEDKHEDVMDDCATKLPVLTEVIDKAINEAPGEPTNLMIEGDNYHSLSVLNYTHAGKIDVIYIDPPYNTGNKDFIYNDRFVDREDGFRHSKWLSFMSKRLELAKNLLTEDGVIFISIDDNEQAHLKLLCDQVFGEGNFVFQFIVDKTAQGANQSLTFKQTHEYCLLYTKGSQDMVNSDVKIELDLKKYKYSDDRGKYAITNSFDSINSPLSANKNRGYTIYYNEKTGEAITRDEYNRKTGAFDKFDQNLIEQGLIPIRPGIRNTIQYPWNWRLSRFESDYRKDLVFMKNKKGEFGIYHKNRSTGLTKDTTLKRFDTRNFGNQLLVDILGEKKFDYPKSLDMMQWVVSKHLNKQATVLDFFAGSGTTGHAVLKLNKEDGGNRKFILCTNNENGIAENITYARIKKVIEGYGDPATSAGKGKWTDGIPANLRYFKTDFVEKEQTDSDTKEKLVLRCAEMLKIREGCYETVVDKGDFKVFVDSRVKPENDSVGSNDNESGSDKDSRNGKRCENDGKGTDDTERVDAQNASKLCAVIFDPDSIPAAVGKLKELNPKTASIYVFSYTNYAYDEEFAQLGRLGIDYKLVPIPESILEVYRSVFRNGEKNE